MPFLSYKEDQALFIVERRMYQELLTERVTFQATPKVTCFLHEKMYAELTPHTPFGTYLIMRKMGLSPTDGSGK